MINKVVSQSQAEEIARLAKEFIAVAENAVGENSVLTVLAMLHIVFSHMENKENIATTLQIILSSADERLHDLGWKMAIGDDGLIAVPLSLDETIN